MTDPLAPTRSPSSIRIRLLGPLEVMVAGRTISVDTRKALAIAALVAAEGRSFARDELAVMFWPDADDEAARGALRRTLSSLRSAIGDSGLRIDRSSVGLEQDVDVDLATLERLATSSRVADLEAAAALARGPFMAGFALRDSPAFDDWQAAAAARLERTVGSLLDRLAAARAENGDVAGALEVLRRRVELDPLDEIGQRRLIERLGQAGDRTGAIHQYRALVALFDRELGVAPLRETTEVYDAIREGRLGPTDERVGDHRRRADEEPATTAKVVGSAVVLPLAGRDGEIRVLERAWRAATPDGRLAVVEGEAGIGKTRLGEAMAATARTAGATVLIARGYPGESAIAYGPIAGLLSSGLALSGGPERLAALDEIARFEIGRLVDLPAGLRVARSSGPDGAGARVRLLDSIARALRALMTGREPGLIWVDDLHHADDASREAVAFLARRLAGHPILLLVAWRREDLSMAGRRTADELVSVAGSTVVTLGRLDRGAIAEMVAAARPAADSALIEGLVDGIAAESEGLPLHVVEALAGDDPFGVSLAGSVQTLLRNRIAAVDETAAQVLSAAAVIGRSFDLATLRHVSGRSEEETVEAIEELTRRGLVRELAGSPGGPIRYDFGHRRLRDAAYEATSAARRRLLHRRTAEAIRLALGGIGRDDVARFALIGAHERDAGRNVEAAAAFREAADRAEDIFANREAVDHLEAVLALGVTEPARVHARIGTLRGRLGEYRLAAASLETAAALADPAELPAIEVALARLHRRRGDLATAVSHLEAALASSDLDAAVRADALVERSLIALRSEDPATADRSARSARKAAEQAADPHRIGVAERLVGLIAQVRGDHATAREALERSRAIATDDPDPTAGIAASAALAVTMAADGAIEDAVTCATSAIESCRRIGDRHLEAAVENHLADLLHAAGREEAAMDHLKRAVALFAEIGEVGPESEPGIWALAAW